MALETYYISIIKFVNCCDSKIVFVFSPPDWIECDGDSLEVNTWITPTTDGTRAGYYLHIATMLGRETRSCVNAL